MKVTGRIAVVDDNESGCYATARMLRAAGHETLEIHNGSDALRLIGPDTDLVVLDVNLPDIDGFEVCRRLRASPVTQYVPVVHLSATFVDDVDQVHGLDAGADGYLTQPVDPGVLVATVNAFLRARHAEALRRRVDHGTDRPPVEHERGRRAQRAALALGPGQHLQRVPLSRNGGLATGMARRAGQWARRHDRPHQIGPLLGKTLRCGVEPRADGLLGGALLRQIDHAGMAAVQTGNQMHRICQIARSLPATGKDRGCDIGMGLAAIGRKQRADRLGRAWTRDLLVLLKRHTQQSRIQPVHTRSAKTPPLASPS